MFPVALRLNTLKKNAERTLQHIPAQQACMTSGSAGFFQGCCNCRQRLACAGANVQSGELGSPLGGACCVRLLSPAVYNASTAFAICHASSPAASLLVQSATEDGASTHSCRD
eukprot:TRINITY_DN5976_c0_g1_i2.p2 TRINITY_DN5976_c0_g1~~TRINITY_DN5976_c0_g1_i2.p2  ORF type:complete len:113 (+),score=6.12 TRINITY_DN5976_c0_g1_i2:119-457(+)